MNKLYEIGGTLNKGFVGQISYTICFEKVYKEMSILFSFDKQYYEVITDELKQSFIRECDGKYTTQSATDEVINRTLKNMKTELQIVVTMNDVFIGGVHRQENPKHLYFSDLQATPGCIPQPSINGVLRITIIAFSVILDATHYNLSLLAH